MGRDRGETQDRASPRAERRLLNPFGPLGEAHTEPFDMGDLGVAHPAGLLLHTVLRSLPGQEEPSPLPKSPPHPLLPPWASPPRPEVAGQLVFPSLPTTLAFSSSWGRK